MPTSVTLRIDMKDYVQYMKRLSSKRYVQAAHRGTLRGALQGVTTIRDSFPDVPKASIEGQPNPVNTGAYKRGWKAEKTFYGARIFNRELYASVIELGRRIGARFPPPKAITNWAQRKLGLSRKDAARAAYSIGRAIVRRGLKERLVMTNQLDKIQSDFLIALQKELVRELSKP